ncbi:MAG: ATP-binding protein [Candidatus Ancillula sp.]|jgi:predicted AAA+ superfamily ATPase|nr:ATP-binding protein [Candidatus Ancillula sp.]
MFMRQIWQKMLCELDSREILVLVGPRQVGKSTTIKWLLENVKSDNCAYFDFTSPRDMQIFDTDDYIKIVNSLKIRGLDLRKRVYIAIDEIQYLQSLPRAVKYLFDNFDIKFLLTGSSSYYLKNHFNESLAGRKIVYDLLPLSFREFLQFKKVKVNLPKISFNDVSFSFDETSYELLNSYYDEYVEFGGFPAVVLEPAAERKRKLIEEIYSSYINLDVKSLADFRNMKELRQLIVLLAERVGNRINVDDLSSVLGCSRVTINSYLEFLEQTYLIKMIPIYSGNKGVSGRKQKKLYFIDTGIAGCNADLSGGQKFENTLCHQLSLLGELTYFNDRDGEIDFILSDYNIDKTTGKNEGVIALEAKQSPTKRYWGPLKTRSSKLEITKFGLVGQRKVAKYHDYLWGGLV